MGFERGHFRGLIRNALLLKFGAGAGTILSTCIQIRGLQGHALTNHLHDTRIVNNHLIGHKSQPVVAFQCFGLARHWLYARTRHPRDCRARPAPSMCEAQ
jgi:hypothetical protein